MKLLIIAQNLLSQHPEGLTKASISIIKSLLRANFNPLVISIGGFRSSYPFSYLKVSNNMLALGDFLKYPEYLLKWQCIEKVFWLYYDFLKALSLINIIPLFTKFELIYLLNLSKVRIYTTILRLLSKIKACKSKVIVHVFSAKLPKPLYKFSGDNIILCSSVLAYRLLVESGGQLVFYMPYPVDTQVYRPINKSAARKLLRLPQDAILVGYIGRLTASRGVDVLVKAFAEVIRGLGDNFNLKLVIVSPPSLPSDPIRVKREEELMLDFIRKFLSRNTIILRRFIPVNLFYSAVDVMVLPFKHVYTPIDPPVTLMEALSSGGTIITTPVGSIKKIMNKGVAYLIEPNNVKMLRDAIEYLVINKKERKRLKRNAREYAIRNLSLEIIGRKLRKIFEEILGS